MVTFRCSISQDDRSSNESNFFSSYMFQENIGWLGVLGLIIRCSAKDFRWGANSIYHKWGSMGRQDSADKHPVLG